jgi:hypothetical protein
VGGSVGEDASWEPGVVAVWGGGPNALLLVLEQDAVLFDPMDSCRLSGFFCCVDAS